MKVEELALTFSCEGAALIGVLHRPASYTTRAVLIVVGGPQTRVGSHRQFVLLARDLAARGVAVFRFDYRGMGDSDGPGRGFENISIDIGVALDAMWAELPGIEDVVLWGLCDAASAAMMYAPSDARVSGIVILNPWVRSEAGEARAYLEHYYARHLLSRDFWRRLLRGEVDVAGSISSLVSFVRTAVPSKRADASADTGAKSFQLRMLERLESFSGPVLLIMSGDDLTAAEFDTWTRGSSRWQRVLAGDLITRCDLPEANHTFSRRLWRDQVADWSRDWLRTW